MVTSVSCSLRIFANARYFSCELPRTACCRVETVVAFQTWSSPRTRTAYSPPTSSMPRKIGESPNASRWRLHRLLGDLVEADALDPGRGAGEVVVDEIGLEPDRVENLRAAIGLIGRDAHLGHHLEQALVDRLDVALDDFLLVELAGQVGVHRDQRLEGEIGIDRFGAVAGEAAEVMHLARLGRFHDEADRGAQPLADQVVMHGRAGRAATASARGRCRPCGRTG